VDEPADLSPPSHSHACKISALLLVLVLFAMMAMTAVDVVGRYLFNAPLAGAQEATEVMLALLVFGAAPLVTFSRQHITTEIFEASIRGRLRHVRDVTVALVTGAICALLAWRIFVQAGEMAAMAGHTPKLGIPISAVLYFCAAMSAICALVALGQALVARRTA
jgi:TRAP-type C4-dicarboxylate transport system permease small subunit